MTQDNTLEERLPEGFALRSPIFLSDECLLVPAQGWGKEKDPKEQAQVIPRVQELKRSIQFRCQIQARNGILHGSTCFLR